MTNGWSEPGMAVSNMQKTMSYAYGNQQQQNALNEVIREHLKAPGDLANLLAGTFFIGADQALAAASLVQRGLERLDVDQKHILQFGDEEAEVKKKGRKFREAGSHPLEANYPISVAAGVCYSFKSQKGFSTRMIVNAIGGARVPDGMFDEDGNPKGSDDNGRPTVVIENSK